jgi:Ni/Co efflux regulator RcnB
MKKLVSLMLGMAFLLGTATFAADDHKKGDKKEHKEEKKEKKGGH